MNSKTKLKPVALAVGAAFATTLAMAPVAQASVNTSTGNPFAIQQLDAGYKVADMGKEGSCGANKAKKTMEDSKDKKMKKEAACGANKAKKEKAKEANCGANKGGMS